MAPPQIDGQADEQIEGGETNDKQPGKEIELTGSYGDGRAAQAACGNAQRIVSLGAPADGLCEQHGIGKGGVVKQIISVQAAAAADKEARRFADILPFCRHGEYKGSSQRIRTVGGVGLIGGIKHFGGGRRSVLRIERTQGKRTR